MKLTVRAISDKSEAYATLVKETNFNGFISEESAVIKLSDKQKKKLTVGQSIELPDNAHVVKRTTKEGGMFSHWVFDTPKG